MCVCRINRTSEEEEKQIRMITEKYNVFILKVLIKHSELINGIKITGQPTQVLKLLYHSQSFNIVSPKKSATALHSYWCYGYMCEPEINTNFDVESSDMMKMNSKLIML